MTPKLPLMEALLSGIHSVILRTGKNLQHYNTCNNYFNICKTQKKANQTNLLGSIFADMILPPLGIVRPHSSVSPG
jgi:hypothetical protein